MSCNNVCKHCNLKQIRKKKSLVQKKNHQSCSFTVVGTLQKSSVYSNNPMYEVHFILILTIRNNHIVLLKLAIKSGLIHHFIH